MEYRIRKQDSGYRPEYNHKSLNGADHWLNLGAHNGSWNEVYCKTVEEAREKIKDFHNKYIKNTVDDESSVVEKFVL